MSTFEKLTSRYRLDCALVADEALHIGTGTASVTTDAPFIRENGHPFLPGSSLRGALRSHLESILRSLDGVRACCTLFEANAPEVCDAGNEAKRKKWESATAAELNQLLNDGLHLCPICELFGSTLKAGKLKISDAMLVAPAEPVRRDGVGINRDTGRAEEHIKYDFEALARGCQFRCGVHLENATDEDLALLFILLKEWESGIDIGGRKARGLGRVRLAGYDVQWFDDLLTYLRTDVFQTDTQAFKEKVRAAFLDLVASDGGANHAEADH